MHARCTLTYYNSNQNSPLQPWYSSTHPSWPTPPSWPYAPPYHPQPVNQPFQPYAPQPQWSNPSQGWRSQLTQPLALPPPPQPQPKLTHPAPPKKPQMHGKPNPTLNKKQE